MTVAKLETGNPVRGRFAQQFLRHGSGKRMTLSGRRRCSVWRKEGERIGLVRSAKSAGRESSEGRDYGERGEGVTIIRPVPGNRGCLQDTNRDTEENEGNGAWYRGRGACVSSAVNRNGREMRMGGGIGAVFRVGPDGGRVNAEGRGCPRSDRAASEGDHFAGPVLGVLFVVEGRIGCGDERRCLFEFAFGGREVDFVDRSRVMSEHGHD